MYKGTSTYMYIPIYSMELDLPIHGPMEGAAVLKLYGPSPTPCLYVAPIDHWSLYILVHTGMY